MPAFHDAQSKEKSIQPVPSPLSMQQARDSTSSVASDRLSHTVDIPKSAEPPVNAVKPGAYAPNRGPRNVPSNQVAASASGDSRSSIQSMTPSDSDNSLPGTRFRNPTAAVGRPARSVASVNLSSPAPPMGHRWTPAPLSSRPSGAASVNGDFDRRSIYPQHQQQWDTASVDPRMMMGGAAAPFFGYYNDPHNVYDGSVYGGDDGYMDGAGMSHLGEPHLTHNSLLDNYRREHLPVHSQEELARASGQPLVQLPNKPPQPKAGLIGVISQLEHEKKEKEASKGRTMDMEREHMLEQERIMFEQRQQMMQQQQAMMGANPYMMNMMGYGMGMNMGMPVMDPRFAMMGSMPMMDPRMPMMNGMNMVGMPMMDPRMSMMGMPAANNMYGQLPMYPPTNGLWNNFQRFNGGIQEEVEDEDDNAPLGKPAGFGSPHMEADKRLSNAYYQRQRQRTNNS
ncbi:uncharacterized protein BYT42DRAFT_555965 [Radiomyces spectabilis]|uniref:uncharacterized protein n=1 Tax=Radiomyces spectabilis TaxID=64574 RepID=UPI00221FA978|nr:uncharacterized protein BYT42DRAFT_555965 [Radiomyces spectabilis]KAI8391185.1 hypothetical protein BYT42DRAFT_555965 [Radiomyces spectabilis]